jgi:hypothetical protein
MSTRQTIVVFPGGSREVNKQRDQRDLDPNRGVMARLRRRTDWLAAQVGLCEARIMQNA